MSNKIFSNISMKNIFLSLIILISLLTIMNINEIKAAGVDGYFLYEKINNNTEIKIIDYLNSGTKDLIIPDYIDGLPVTVIGEQAFFSKELQGSVNLPSFLVTIEKEAFIHEVGIQNVFFKKTNLEYIGEKAFYHCSIKTLILPNKIIKIDEYAFSSNNINSIIFNDNLKIIGEGAFYLNSLGGDIHFPDSVEYIGDDAFFRSDKFSEKKAKITGIYLGNNVKIIGSRAFQSLKIQYKFIIPDSVEYIGGGAFANEEGTIKTLILGNNVEIIEHYAFQNQPLSGELIIPDSVKEIGEGAFYESNLNSLILGTGLEYIGKNAFYDNNLSGILEIPKNVIQIDNFAFFDNSLNFVTFSGLNIKSIGCGAFNLNYFNKFELPKIDSKMKDYVWIQTTFPKNNLFNLNKDDFIYFGSEDVVETNYCYYRIQ